MIPNLRSIIINLFDEPHGVAEKTYRDLVAYATSVETSQGEFDDIWAALESGEDFNGKYRFWLGEVQAEELRAK